MYILIIDESLTSVPVEYWFAIFRTYAEACKAAAEARALVSSDDAAKIEVREFTTPHGNG